MGWSRKGGTPLEGNKKVVIVGNGIGVAQCALTLADLGINTTVITPSLDLGSDYNADSPDMNSHDLVQIRPLLLRLVSHSHVQVYTGSEVDNIAKCQGRLDITATRYPRYVHEDLCSSCGRCAEACSVKIPFIQEGWSQTHRAVHGSLLGTHGVPSAYSIDKQGIASCSAACPAGINVQGFVSLMAGGKVDRALELIGEAAPLAGVLGRVCTHPCEDACKRSEVDAPVFIRGLHRYAADYASGDITYKLKARAKSRRDKIAIVGSGPAGLTAAWELARRGYTPVIFESHAVVGGMLATGIPRFRLPREVREREVKAIEALGVEIRTGITIGRDVTLADLRERDYRAFFLAIGAHDNRGLGIPGEDLDGVVDSISLLFELNMKVGASVGRNLVVVGGGNSAVDSARAAMRRGKRIVTIMYRRTADEMTAVPEDIEEAIGEGISILYLTSPIEIIGDDTRVIGIRCQRMELGAVEEDGRRKPIPIPGSEFDLEADHVVLAIGQRPNTRQLNIKGLRTSNADATVYVDPLTLETNVPGVFAGGDCVTGPNCVVDAVAWGKRAAESIDRHLKGRDLRKYRELPQTEPVQVSISERYASPHKRADMPLIPRSKRMGTFEETSMGLRHDIVEREAQRCLSCALCSGCLECERACGLDAICHDDCAEEIQIEADMIIDFTPSDTKESRGLSYRHISPNDTICAEPGIYRIHTEGGVSLWNELAQASSVALEVASLIKSPGDRIPPTLLDTNTKISSPRSYSEAAKERSRTGVVLCQCGGSISSVMNFQEMKKRILTLPNVFSVKEVPQLCTNQGAIEVADHARDLALDRVVVGACRCCNLKQICYSCTDRRVMSQQYLEQHLVSPLGVALEFVNIREQCAWAHKDDPPNATNKAIELISAGVAKTTALLEGVYELYPVHESVIVIGMSLYGVAAAKKLTDQGCTVTIISGPDQYTKELLTNTECNERWKELLRQAKEGGTEIWPWPTIVELDGLPGNYNVVLTHNFKTKHLNAGAVILDMSGMGHETNEVSGVVSSHSLLGRIIEREGHRYGQTSDLIRGMTIRNTAGIFIVPSDVKDTAEEQIAKGAASAARAWIYISQGALEPRPTAVVINNKLCRGCGECTALCPYLEIKVSDSGTAYAHVDRALCLGCGACITHCPTGAISQPFQRDEEIASMMEGLLSVSRITSEVT